MKKLIFLFVSIILLSFTNLNAQNRVVLSSYEVMVTTSNEKELKFSPNSQELNFIAQKIEESNINEKEKFNAVVSLKHSELSVKLSKDIDQAELKAYLNYIGIKASEEMLKLFTKELAN